MTRAEARVQGLKRYLSGVPCPHGHDAERFVSSGTCVVCVSERSAKWRRKNPERHAQTVLSWISQNRDRVRASRRSAYHLDLEKSRNRNKAKRAASPEKSKERARRYLERNREKALERSRKWKDANRERTIEASREWRKKNPDAGRLWHTNNREQSRANVRNRYARKKRAAGSHTAEDIRNILEAQGHRCPYCRANLRRVQRHVDHIVPLARGGSNDCSNLQVTCKPCNLSKSDRDPIEFAQQMGRLL